MDVCDVVVSLMLCAFGIGSAIGAVFTFKPIYGNLKAEFEAKTCIVKNTTIRTWWSNNKQGRHLFLPQVLVHVDPSVELRNSSGSIWDVWACRYLEEYSSTAITNYEGGPDSWLSTFSVGSNVSCWQSKDDPEVVKLSAEAGASQCKLFFGCFEIWTPPVLLAFFAILLLSVLIYVCTMEFCCTKSMAKEETSTYKPMEATRTYKLAASQEEGNLEDRTQEQSLLSCCSKKKSNAVGRKQWVLS